jgi:hypothetical protein
MMNLHCVLCEYCHKRCASFAFAGERRRRCGLHQLEGMINIYAAQCVCGKRVPSMAFEGQPPTHCTECKEKGMVCVSNKPCASNDRGIPCPVSGNSKYDMYCTHCFQHLFPTDPRAVTIRTHEKELAVVKYLARFPWFEGFVHDKSFHVDLEGGCCATKRRIDLRKLIGNTLLCLEIDENQHKYRLPTYERDRYNDLFMDFSGKYIFVRYNPDPYRVGDDKVDPDFATRMSELVVLMQAQIARIEAEANDFFEIQHLFYDEQ